MMQKFRGALLLASALMIAPSLAEAGTFKTLHSFSGLSDGGVPLGNLLWLNGSLYGTAQFGGTYGTSDCPDGCGVVFQMNPKTGKETVIYSFQGGSDGTLPAAGLIAANGLFYGTTSLGGGQTCFDSTQGCGTVFQLDPTTGQETVLYPFGDNGVDGELVGSGVTLVGDTLYGTTEIGGTNQVGNIFGLDLDGDIGSNLYSFGPDEEFPETGLVALDGTVYGTTFGQATQYGSVFAYDIATGTETVVHQFAQQDGHLPEGGLIVVDGKLFGTTTGGGNQDGAGTVYEIDPSSGAETVIYEFGNNAGDGRAPVGTLVAVGHKLYGVTEYGGNAGCTGNQGCGTIFEVTPARGTEKVLYSFTGGSDEGNPQAGLTYTHGAFYGTTARNGQNSCYNDQGCGTVFRLMR
jgi:uncharacterized repeat protein (TIGR03803 family)